MSQPLLDDLRARTPAMLDALRALVEAESPTADPAACTACAEVADKLAVELLGSRGERHETDGRVHLRWRFGSATRVLLIGHLDTVWPLGTLARWPFAVHEGRATGPGVFDMKAGVVQLLFALSTLDSLDGVTVLLTTDEETGSPTARPLIVETASDIPAALVLEPSAAGALKTERKGVGLFRIDVRGRAAHTGLDPENGANAVVEAAHQILAIAALAQPELGTTVSPTIVTGGTAVNTVPADASVKVDVRTRTVAEADRVAAQLAELRAVTPGTSVHVERAVGIPPFEHRFSVELFTRAQRHAADLGLPPLREASVGGASDGNLIASLGVPVLDGLGAVGDHAHGEGEYVEVAALAERAALVAALVGDLVGRTDPSSTDLAEHTKRRGPAAESLEAP